MDSVAVIILTKNNFDIIKKCLDSFEEKNTYNNIKFYIGDTGSNKECLSKLINYLENFKYKKELLKFNYYNFAKNHNWIISNRVKEDYILFCNDDITLINNALSILMGNTEKDLGTIGCKLLYPNNNIQHGGHIHLHMEHSIEVTHKHLNQQNMVLQTEYNVGNTFAFALVNTQVYKNVNGLDEGYFKCFEDVDFCLKCSKEKYKHKFVGHAECYHHESLSRKKTGSTFDLRDCEKIRNKLKEFYNK